MRNFTRVSESLPPEELRALVNRFFSAMTQAIRAQRGTLDKYIGDAIMAFWGAPVADADHACHAVRAALAMSARLGELNAALRARGLPEIGVGIGINSGLVCVGDMGSDIRRSYTVMGDAVNLASRIEALTRHYGVDILVGESTAEAAGARCSFVEIDRVRVKGKETAVTLFTPVPDALVGTHSFDEEMRLWRLALEAYRKQDAPQALAALQALRTRFAASAWSGLYQRFGERVARWADEPLPPGWDGTHTFDSK
jgi:adenylate cyclase